MTVKAYSYLRFSSAAQAEGDSLRRQLKAANDWAAENSDILLDTSTRDLGVSAFKGEHRVKGALASFLERVRRGEIPKGSFFLVESFDRLSRENETVAINLLTSITLAGIKVVTLTDGAIYDDKSDAMDLMRAIIVMSRAHEENKARGKKLAAAWADKKKRARETGEILSRRGPAWTLFNETTGRFDLIPERAEIVRRIFDQCNSGFGGSTIAALLNSDGVEPFRRPGNNGNGWHVGYILTILQSRSVLGFYQPQNVIKEPGKRMVRTDDGEAIAGYYPAVVDEETFARAQSLIRQRNKRGGGAGRRGAAFPNMLLGLGRCETCGGTLIIGSRNNSTVVRHYRCYERSRAKNCLNRKTYLCADVEDVISDALVRVKMDRDQPTDDHRDLTLKVEQIGQTKARIGALIDQLELGIPAISERLRERQTELVRLEAEANELRNAVAGRTNRRASDAIMEAITWWRDLSRLTGPELYAARAKANSLLNETFDWIMPVGDVLSEGVYMGVGEQAWWIGRVDGTDTTAKFEVPEGTKITKAALEALRGPLAPFELPEALRQAEEAERALDA